MQALFRMRSTLATNAAVFVEADGSRPAFAAVAILHLSIAAGDGVRCAKGAFDVGAGHAGADLLTDHRATPRIASDTVSASIVLLPHDGKRSCCFLLGALALRQWLGHGYGFARAWRWVERLLDLSGLICWAALLAEREIACSIDAAIDVCGEQWSGVEKQGATARGE